MATFRRSAEPTNDNRDPKNGAADTILSDPRPLPAIVFFPRDHRSQEICVANRSAQPRCTVVAAHADAAPADRFSLWLGSALQWTRTCLSWTVAGQASGALCQMALIVFLAKAGSPVAVGVFSIAAAILAPLFAVCNLQLRGIQCVDAGGEFRFEDCLGLRLVTTAFAVAIGIIIAIVARWYDANVAACVAAMTLVRAAESIADVFYGFYQKHEVHKYFGISTAGKSVLGLMLFAAVYLLTSQLAWATLAFALGICGVLAMFDIPRAAQIQFGHEKILDTDTAGDTPHRLEVRFSWKPMQRLITHSLPLAIVAFLLTAQYQLPRYYVQYYMGPSAVGILSALLTITLVGQLCANCVAQAAAPRLARFFHDRELGRLRRAVALLVGCAMAIGGVFILIAAVSGEGLLRLVFTREFADHQALLLVLTIYGFISYVNAFLGTSLTAVQCHRRLPWYNVLALGTIAATAPLLIRCGGLCGAGTAMVLGALVLLVTYAASLASALGVADMWRSRHGS